jgi:hypothetical protein
MSALLNPVVHRMQRASCGGVGIAGPAGPASRFRSDNPAGTLQERPARRVPNRWTQLGTVRGSFRHSKAGTLAREMLHSRRFFRRKSGAGDGIRTHDPNLGKVVLYP